MAIVKMKRLRLFGLIRDRDAMFTQLQHLGCVDISQQTDILEDPEWASLLRKEDSDESEKSQLLAETEQALKALDTCCPEKTGLLSPRKVVLENDLFRESTLSEARDVVRQINAYVQDSQENLSQIARLNATIKTLTPWLSLDIPLNTTSTSSTYVAFGTIPASADLEAVKKDLAVHAEASELFTASSDSDAHYVLFFCHKSQLEEGLDVMKSYGFSTTTFKGITGTAFETTSYLHSQIGTLELQNESINEALRAFGEHRPKLQLLYDNLTQELQKETFRKRLWDTETLFFLDGWAPAEETERLSSLLNGYDCAYELTEPKEEDYPEVPVKLKNSVLTRCMNVVTEMYSLPAYDGIDPNPLMAPFFIFFFGMMMADMAYGLIMIIAGIVVLKKSNPREGMRNFFELVLFCGISTFIMGAITGGFFGDFIPQLIRFFNPESTFDLPHLFTPLDDTITILIGSLILGLIQIITGMIVSVVKKCKDGNVADAIWDEVTWWIILLGVGLMVLKVGNVAGYPVVLIIGGLMLIYGSTRNAKGFGKVTAVISAVYNGVSGFFSDTLSYLRLMALMLSGSVIAQVFNTLGSAFGNVVFFIIISMIGNALNLALNLLGCYVHDLRLQCLEYFNRFYKDGGKAFNPLAINTKYYDIIKEEQ